MTRFVDVSLLRPELFIDLKTKQKEINSVLIHFYEKLSDALLASLRIRLGSWPALLFSTAENI